MEAANVGSSHCWPRTQHGAGAGLGCGQSAAGAALPRCDTARGMGPAAGNLRLPGFGGPTPALWGWPHGCRLWEDFGGDPLGEGPLIPFCSRAAPTWVHIIQGRCSSIQPRLLPRSMPSAEPWSGPGGFHASPREGRDPQRRPQHHSQGAAGAMLSPACASPTFSMGTCCPSLRDMFILKKKKKKKRQNQKGEMASRALRSSKINDVVKGKLSSNHSAGEVLSRHGTGTWGLVCSSSEGTRSTWRGQRGIHGAVGSTGQCSQRGQQHIPSAPCSPCTVAPWPQPLLRLSPQRGDEWETHGSCQK